MGWFESQVEERRRSDDERLEAALRRLSDSVTGGHTADAGSKVAQATGALDIVLAYYGVEGSDAPRGVIVNATSVGSWRPILKWRSGSAS